MGTKNRIMFDETLEKYKKSGQVKIKNGQLSFLEKDKEKRNEIAWELASYSPHFTLQWLKND